jgi:hypothetical protein
MRLSRSGFAALVRAVAVGVGVGSAGLAWGQSFWTNGAGSRQWDVAGNWIGGVPNSATAQAQFGFTADGLVMMPAGGATVNRLTFSNSTGFVFAGPVSFQVPGLTLTGLTPRLVVVPDLGSAGRVIQFNTTVAVRGTGAGFESGDVNSLVTFSEPLLPFNSTLQIGGGNWEFVKGVAGFGSQIFVGNSTIPTVVDWGRAGVAGGVQSYNSTLAIGAGGVVKLNHANALSPGGGQVSVGGGGALVINFGSTALTRSVTLLNGGTLGSTAPLAVMGGELLLPVDNSAASVVSSAGLQLSSVRFANNVTLNLQAGGGVPLILPTVFAPAAFGNVMVANVTGGTVSAPVGMNAPGVRFNFAGFNTTLLLNGGTVVGNDWTIRNDTSMVVGATSQIEGSLRLVDGGGLRIVSLSPVELNITSSVQVGATSSVLIGDATLAPTHVRLFAPATGSGGWNIASGSVLETFYGMSNVSTTVVAGTVIGHSAVDPGTKVLLDGGRWIAQGGQFLPGPIVLPQLGSSVEFVSNSTSLSVLGAMQIINSTLVLSGPGGSGGSVPGLVLMNEAFLPATTNPTLVLNPDIILTMRSAPLLRNDLTLSVLGEAVLESPFVGGRVQMAQTGAVVTINPTAGSIVFDKPLEFLVGNSTGTVRPTIQKPIILFTDGMQNRGSSNVSLILPGEPDVTLRKKSPPSVGAHNIMMRFVDGGIVRFEAGNWSTTSVSGSWNATTTLEFENGVTYLDKIEAGAEGVFRTAGGAGKGIYINSTTILIPPDSRVGFEPGIGSSLQLAGDMVVGHNATMSVHSDPGGPNRKTTVGPGLLSADELSILNIQVPTGTLRWELNHTSNFVLPRVTLGDLAVGPATLELATDRFGDADVSPVERIDVRGLGSVIRFIDDPGLGRLHLNISTTIQVSTPELVFEPGGFTGSTMEIRAPRIFTNESTTIQVNGRVATGQGGELIVRGQTVAPLSTPVEWNISGGATVNFLDGLTRPSDSVALSGGTLRGEGRVEGEVRVLPAGGAISATTGPLFLTGQVVLFPGSLLAVSGPEPVVFRNLNGPSNSTLTVTGGVVGFQGNTGYNHTSIVSNSTIVLDGIRPTVRPPFPPIGSFNITEGTVTGGTQQPLVQGYFGTPTVTTDTVIAPRVMEALRQQLGLNVGSPEAAWLEFGAGLTSEGGTYAFDLDGPLAGLEYDQLVVSGGTLSLLADVDLDLRGTYVPNIGDMFWLVDNQTGNPVVGTFAGLPNRSFTPHNGLAFQIFYDANILTGQTSGGNDVLIVVVPEPAALGLVGLAAPLLMRRRR